MREAPKKISEAELNAWVQANLVLNTDPRLTIYKKLKAKDVNDIIKESKLKEA